MSNRPSPICAIVVACVCLCLCLCASCIPKQMHSLSVGEVSSQGCAGLDTIFELYATINLCKALYIFSTCVDLNYGVYAQNFKTFLL